MEKTITITPEERLRRVLGLAGCLYEEHRHQFACQHLAEIIAIQRQLENLLNTVAQERGQYESWLNHISTN